MLTPATATGRVVPGAGHGSPYATRMKKYAVKKAPKTITSEMMKSSIPSSWGSTRELRLAERKPVLLVLVMAGRVSDAGCLPLLGDLRSALCGGSRGRGGLQVYDDVLHQAEVTPCALDQVGAQPAGALTGQGGDDHVVDLGAAPAR